MNKDCPENSSHHDRSHPERLFFIHKYHCIDKLQRASSTEAIRGDFMRRVHKLALALSIAVLLAACVNANDLAKQIGASPEKAVELRNLQSRRFDTLDHTRMLLAATDTLQDLGYTITESSSDVGVLVGSKQRDAEETGQVAGQVMLTVLFAAMGSYYNPVWDKSQSIHVTLTTTPIENSKQVEVRVSFDRYLTNNQGHEWRAELILDEAIYREFFDKLAAGVFLEAHTI